MDAYQKMLAAMDDQKKLSEIRRNLLAYCQLDTLAMVRILEALEKLE
jgi:hypothetical protein